MTTKPERVSTQHPVTKFDWVLVALLSTTAGAADVVSFLGLGGLFVAHITGNLVILAAHYVTAGFSQIGPILSVPVFIVALALVTSVFAGREQRPALRALLILHCALLCGFLAVGVAFGPLANPDSALAVCCGMLGVSAMATQSAMIKLHLPGFPSTAVLTTNTVQLTIDLIVLNRGKFKPDEVARARQRVRLMLPAVSGFAAGCTAGAFLELRLGLWAALLPVATAVLACILGEMRERAARFAEALKKYTLALPKPQPTGLERLGT